MYDPSHRPPGWQSRLREGQFAVILLDARTRSERGADGRPLAPGAARTCVVFDHLPAARAFCRRRVGEVDDLICEIYDHRGKSAAPLQTFASPAFEGHVLSRSSARRKVAVAMTLFLISPVLMLYDYRAGGGLILPTVLGINGVFVGIRLLVWAHGEGTALRRRELDAIEAERSARPDGVKEA